MQYSNEFRSNTPEKYIRKLWKISKPKTVNYLKYVNMKSYMDLQRTLRKRYCIYPL